MPHDIILPNGFTPFEPELATANDWLDEVPPANPEDHPWAAGGGARLLEATASTVKGAQPHEEAIGIASADVGRWVGKTPSDVAFAVAGLIPSGAATAAGGDGGAGKGVLLQTVSSCVSLGLPFLGRATRRGAAVYISAEDPEPVLHLRQQRIAAELGVDLADFTGRLFVKSTSDRELFLYSDGKPTALSEKFEAELADIPDLAFVGIDSASLVFDDDENARRRVGAFMRGLNRMAGRLSTAICILIHTSKSADDSPSKAFSGSTAWTWQARAALLLKAETKNEPPSLSLIKSNYSKPGVKIDLRWTERHVLVAANEPSGTVKSIEKRTVEREILARVEKAWGKDNPLSATANVGRERYLPAVLGRAGFKSGQVRDAMLSLIDAGVLVTDSRTTRSPKGLRIEKAPLWYTEAADAPAK